MRTSGRWEDPPEPLRLGRGRSWVPSPRPASEVPQVCRPAPRPQRPERTWDDQGTLSRPPTLFRPPRPSSPEKCDPAPGQAASEAGAPGLLPGWPPARPGPAGPRVWVLRAPQVARDAPGESGNRSPRGGGRGALGSAGRTRSSGRRATRATRAWCGPSRTPRPAPRGPAPAGGQARAARVLGPLREASLSPVGAGVGSLHPSPPSNASLQEKWFYSGAGSGHGGGVQAWGVEYEEWSTLFFSRFPETKNGSPFLQSS